MAACKSDDECRPYTHWDGTQRSWLTTSKGHCLTKAGYETPTGEKYYDAGISQCAPLTNTSPVMCQVNSDCLCGLCSEGLCHNTPDCSSDLASIKYLNITPIVTVNGACDGKLRVGDTVIDQSSSATVQINKDNEGYFHWRCDASAERDRFNDSSLNNSRQDDDVTAGTLTQGCINVNVSRSGRDITFGLLDIACDSPPKACDRPVDHTNDVCSGKVTMLDGWTANGDSVNVFTDPQGHFSWACDGVPQVSRFTYQDANSCMTVRATTDEGRGKGVLFEKCGPSRPGKC